MIPRVVELVRVSTDAQKEKATHEVQRQALDTLRKTRPGTVVRRLEALGVSGAKGVADRIDLQELRELSTSKAYDELRVFSIDRLTRSDDPRERAAIYGMVLDAEAKIVDVNGRVIDPAKDGDLGELDYFLQTLFSARERKKIGMRTLAGRKLKAEQGKLSQGKAPYGRVLNRTTMTWELVPHEVETYRRIIDAFLKGDSTRSIAKALNKARVMPSVRERWGKSTILHMLKTPAIVGRYEACGHLTAIPPIATEAEWDRIRATLQQNVSRPPDTEPIDALMRQRLVCGACGLVCHVVSDGVGSKPRYVCPKPGRRETACPDRRSVRVEDADAAVSKQITELGMNKKALLRALRSAREEVEDPKLLLTRLEADVSKLVAREARTLGLLNEGLLSDDLARRELAGIKTARAEAESRRKALSEAALPPPSAADVRGALHAFILDLGSPEGLQKAISLIIPVLPGCGMRLVRKGIELRGRIPVGATFLPFCEVAEC